MGDQYARAEREGSVAPAEPELGGGTAFQRAAKSGTRPRLALGLAVVLAAAAVAGAAPAAPAGATSRSPAHGRVEILRVPSGDADHKLRQVWVYRPPGADRADLPVVYFLHGDPGNHRNGDSVGLAALLDRAFATVGHRFVMVLPNGGSAVHPDTEWADSIDGKVRLESFVTGGLVRAVEGHHPRSRHHRALPVM